MKVQPLLLAALIAVSSCKSAAHKPSVGLMATPPPNGRVIGFDPSVVGLPGAISDTVYDSAGIISWVKYDTANTAWRPVPVSQFVTGDPSQAPGLKAPIGFVVTMTDGSASWVKSTASDTGWVTNPGGGGGGTVTAGTGISVSVDGGVATVTNAAPATSDQVYQKLNSASAPVTVGEWKTDFISNTAGAEYSYYHATVLNNGSPVTFPIEASNLSGAISVTTSGSTPSEAMPPTTDEFLIILGGDVTSLTVTELDDSKDHHYRIYCPKFVNAAAQVSLKPNGVAGSNATGYFFSNPGGAGNPFTPEATSGFMFMDADTSGVLGGSVADLYATTGVSRYFSVNMLTQTSGGFTESYQAIDTVHTATMTSLVFAGAMKAGTQLYIIRPRPTRN